MCDWGGRVMEDTKSKVLNGINSILINQGIEVETLDTDNLVKSGMNSIIFISLVVQLEQAFGIEFNDDFLDYSKLTSLDQIVGYVDELIQAKECRKED